MEQADSSQGPQAQDAPRGDTFDIGTLTDSSGVAVGRSSQAFRAGDVRGSIIQAQGAVGDVITGEFVTIYQKSDKLPASNRQALAPPDTYVPRPEVETKLSELLAVRSGKMELVNLHGLPGVGKTMVARKIAAALQDAFPDGTLWADLEAMTPNDILASFIEPFAPSFDRSAVRKDQYLNVFERVLSQKRVLMVLDQVRDSSTIAQLVPRSCPNVTVLVISNAPLPALAEGQRVYVPEMNADEAVQLFRNLWNGTLLFADEQAVRSLAEQLSYVPAMIVVVARDMITGQISPLDYLNDLRSRKQSGAVGASLANPGLDAVFKNLPFDARQVLPFLGVLGEGIWTLDVLANVSRVARDSAGLGLEQLHEKGLVTRVSPRRCQSAPMVRDFALQKLRELGGDALVRTARTLVGHYYLLQNQQIVSRYRQELLTEFLAQGEDAQQEFTAELNRSFLAAHTQDNVHLTSLAQADPNLTNLDIIADMFEKVVLKNSAFFAAWTERLAAQSVRDAKPHLKDTLRWALEQQDWGLVRRHAILSPDDMFTNFVITKGNQDKTNVTIKADFCLLRDWTMSDASLVSELTASRWVNLIANDCEFISTKWLGVRLERPIFDDVDMVGAQALGTVFMDGVFQGVDLRNSDLRGSIFYNCVFQDVNFRTANLDEVEFVKTNIGAHVDFRNTRFSSLTSGAEPGDIVGGRITVRRGNFNRDEEADTVIHNPVSPNPGFR